MVRTIVRLSFQNQCGSNGIGSCWQNQQNNDRDHQHVEPGPEHDGLDEIDRSVTHEVGEARTKDRKGDGQHRNAGSTDNTGHID